MAIAGGAVPTLRLEMADKGRLKVRSNGSMAREAARENVGEIVDWLLAGEVVYANATGNRLDLVETELRRRGVVFQLWQW